MTFLITSLHKFGRMDHSLLMISYLKSDISHTEQIIRIIFLKMKNEVGRSIIFAQCSVFGKTSIESAVYVLG